MMLKILSRWRGILLSLILCVALMTTSCSSKYSSPYSQTQKDTTRWGAPAAVDKRAEQGATFNQFFPNGTQGYEVVPTQEKKGFAEYKLNKEGKTLAMLSISDTRSLPTAAAKYQSSIFKVANYPAVDQGTTTTGILVNDRYQVKVLSRDPSFTREDRIAWLQKFDLAGLAQLEAGKATAKKEPIKVPDTTTAPRLPLPTTPQPSVQKAKRPVLAPQPAA